MPTPKDHEKNSYILSLENINAWVLFHVSKLNEMTYEWIHIGNQPCEELLCGESTKR